MQISADGNEIKTPTSEIINSPGTAMRMLTNLSKASKPDTSPASPATGAIKDFLSGVKDTKNE